jgi:phosphoribosylaminoimidazolecarboxamide formyltransferase/IMP cyclohydrolase
MSRFALISVSNKTGLDQLGKRLNALGWSVLSTGGTAAALREAQCDVVEVGSHTGFPEILDGRVKTLHPRIFAGILAAPIAEHRQQLDELEIPEIDLVVVNLYPFKETVAREQVSASEVIEQIDIGGPSLIRAAAKNHDRVSVIVDPADYDAILTQMEAGEVSTETRRQLAQKAFRHTAAYDAAIAAELPRFLAEGTRDPAATAANSLLEAQVIPLRYGENPHQWGQLARCEPRRGLAGGEQLQGKELSYNNLGDTTGAWRLVWDLPGPGVAIIKHGNPCGVAVAESMADAFRLARETDPVSAFGGVIVANRAVDENFAAAVTEQFAEVVAAPGYSDAALETLKRKKNLRVLRVDGPANDPIVVRSVDGGFLLQQADLGWDGEEREVATERVPSAEELEALELVWRVAKHAGSNAIIVGKSGQILGIGAGQMSRVDAAKIAVSKAKEMGHDLTESVAGSDAFFPFPDGVEALHEAGIRAVIQPGGSIRDAEVIDACNRLDVAMILTRRRHFRH